MKKITLSILVTGLLLTTYIPSVNAVTYPISTNTIDNNIDITTETKPCPCQKTNTNNFGTRDFMLGYLGFSSPGGPTQPDPIVELTGSYPSSWDWRNAIYKGKTGDWTTPIRDQGYCSSCWAFAAVAALEAVYNIQNGDPNLDIDLSEQYLVSSSAGDGCCGGYFSNTLNFLRFSGTIEEECLPYGAVDALGRNASDCDKTPPYSNDPIKQSDRCSEWKDQVIRVSRYGYINGDASMKNAIYKYGPIVAFMDVYSSFKNYTNGIYESEIGDEFLGFHTVIIVGYDDSQQCWICKNSWGTGWGETKDGQPSNGTNGGWFRIKYGQDDIGLTAAYYTGFTKSKARSTEVNPFLLKFLERFSHAFPILQQLLKL